MKPVYIAIDCEFTDGDLVRGQLMQLALVDVETNAAWSSVVPIDLDARVNQWVKTNLPHLVSASLQQALHTNHLPPIQVGQRSVPASLVGLAYGAKEWLQHRQTEAMFNWKGEPFDPAEVDQHFPLVLVTYCGGYDFGFIAKLFNTAGLENPFHYEMLDISGLAMGVFPRLLDWGFTSDDLGSILDMEPNTQAHDALADARHQAEMFRRLMHARKGKKEQ